MGASLIALVQMVFWLFNILLLARVLLSWFQLDPNNQVVRFIYQATEPILAPIRKMLPASGMIDFSPMLALIGAFVLEALILSLLVAIF